MKRTFGWLVFASLVLAGAQSAHAGLLELHLGAGLNAAKPDSFEDRVGAVSGENLDSDNFDNFFADVYFDIPVLPIGVGVRHEWIQADQSSGGKKWEIDARNLSVIADWRLINTGIYFGPIISIGYPWADVDFSGSSDNISDQIDGDQLSYAGGLEAGVKLGSFLVGAEAGYTSIKFGKTNSQNNTTESAIDLSGFYGKAMIGLAFF